MTTCETSNIQLDKNKGLQENGFVNDKYKNLVIVYLKKHLVYQYYYRNITCLIYVCFIYD